MASCYLLGTVSPDSVGSADQRPRRSWTKGASPRDAVSSLADGPGGWLQRANFMIVGGLYCFAARGLARSSRLTVGPRVVPALIFGAGAGLIVSGLIVTDPLGGFPPGFA